MSRPRELLIATTNRKKKKEIVSLLRGLRVRILTLDDFENIPAIKEDKKTFRENAVKKAVVTSGRARRLTLAEDSGLEVEALDGLPGVRSARFAGPAKNDGANIRKLLRVLEGAPPGKRKARFVCFAALAENGRLIRVVSGSVSGAISSEPKGSFGFGYDPVFYYPPLKKNFAELKPAVKNQLSHRYKAIVKIKKILQEVL
jgi:XTP/dITP diphosphohydrolase